MSKSKYINKGLGSKNLTNILKNDDYDDFNILEPELEYIDSLFDNVCYADFELSYHNENKPHKSDYGYFNYYEYFQDLNEWKNQKNKLKVISNNADKKYVDYESNFELKKQKASKISENINKILTDKDYENFKEEQRRYKIEYIFYPVIDEIKNYTTDG